MHQKFYLAVKEEEDWKTQKMIEIKIKRQSFYRNKKVANNLS